MAVCTKGKKEERRAEQCVTMEAEGKLDGHQQQ